MWTRGVFSAACILAVLMASSADAFVQIAFTATNHRELPTHPGQRLVLPDIVDGIQDHYNTATGTFTAPYSGLYVFNVVLTISNGCEFHSYLKVNSRSVGRVYADDKTEWDQASLSTIVRLNAGDQVYNEVAASTGSNCRLANAYASIFSGFLL